MKKRSILLSTVLGICFCLALALPAWAVEEDVLNEAVIQDLISNVTLDNENFTVTSLVKVENDSKVNIFDVTLADEKTFVEVYSTFDNISVSDIENYLLQANYAIAQENVISRFNQEEVVEDITYNYVDDEKVVCYTIRDGKQRLFISEPIAEDKLKSLNVQLPEINYNNQISLYANNRFDDGGIGIRGIAKQKGSYISAKVSNITVKDFNESYNLYYYLGLNNSSSNADMGISYSTKDGGSWLPYYLLQQNGKVYMISGSGSYIPVDYYPEGFDTSSGSKVSFSTNDPINMTLYKNIVSYGNAQRGTMVRLSLSGKDAASGNSSRYIAEGGTGISDSVTYRVLATICRRDEQEVPANTWIGMTCNFSNVNVDGIGVSWDGNVEAYMSTITRKATGILEGKINMN